MDFDDILYRISENDESAFRELFESLFPGLLSFAISLLKDKHQAEEVVEDVFVKLWEGRQTLDRIGNISSYLYSAVRYASISALEKRKRHKSISLDEVGEALSFSFRHQGASLINEENCRKISDAIDQLPPKCRLIFRLIKEDHMKYKEVAQLLDISEKTVENQMNIAIKKLIDTLKADLPEFPLYFLPKKS
jgi:RNA polymerase sigma-70 factor (ECF subfamily)